MDTELDAKTLTVRIPMALGRRGGRKVVTPMASAGSSPPSSEPNATLLKALGRAFYWRRLIETGVHATVDDLAKAETLNPSFVSRLLAPAIVEAALTGQRLHLASMLRPFSVEWDGQRF